MDTLLHQAPEQSGNVNRSASVVDFRRNAPRKLRIALVGTFTPRKCGIATFTSDIFEKLAEFHPEITAEVYALDDPRRRESYRGVPGIAGIINSEDAADYEEAARAINDSGVDAVWLQHEYGIFGGPDGEMVCDFVDRLAAPLILTPHTMLEHPGERQDAILRRLVARASRIMVMSRYSRDLLATRYGAPNELLEVIDHGAPDRPFGRQEEFKERFGLAGRRVLTTFGLLGPGKGLEHAVAALPAIVAEHPDVLYRIIGATHPNLIAEQGESYREGLQARAAELGVSDHIEWVDRFLDTDELLDQLEACDIYLTPYPNLQQSTSGTLSYAVALGKAVVSTPYRHARELLVDDVGCIIEPASADAIATAVNHLLGDPAALEGLQRRAYAKGRETIWPRFAAKSARLIARAAAPAPRTHAGLPTPSLEGVLDMTDGTGMYQHAIGIVPDRRHGYCLDDNARALMLANLVEDLPSQERSRLAVTYASFVQHAWNEDARVFRNFMRFDRSWCEHEGSDDSNGRAAWALGRTLADSPDQDIREWARIWFDRTFPAFDANGSPRAVAFAMLGAAARLRIEPEHAVSRAYLEQGGAFLAQLLEKARRPDWAWFEAVLGYDNPRLSQALVEAGHLLGREDFLACGIDTLAWIAERQIGASGQFRPIGSDSFGHEHRHLPFDQQPLEAQAAIEATHSAFRATRDHRWKIHARAAWNWFFGANDRGAVLADIATGRCRDGINPRGPNANCGAESILAFQLAHYSMIALETEVGGDSRGGFDGARDERVESAIAAP
ncbi:glycosyltransferase family 4 protein [Aurantiacibacter arachoides]|uniref:glycosyltransferase family 4 protein n=1 Tax=Aurantiacibacter arachoides TaxID=1850444 RepID=UPI00199C82FB|nr:glycosyltransferase family 4 protein [Aurantiacibacter arachoides]GGD59157.1 glycosyl transferase [Aurantiacibacter arachoides]